jgi:hypothetical protein
MIDNLEHPAASALVTWLSAAEGGRASGPPSAPVYAANCEFALGGKRETVPGWPATAELFSVLIQRVDDAPEGAWLCNVDFFAKDLVAAYLAPGAHMIVMEGPKVVGDATICEVFNTDERDPER